MSLKMPKELNNCKEQPCSNNAPATDGEGGTNSRRWDDDTAVEEVEECCGMEVDGSLATQQLLLSSPSSPRTVVTKDDQVRCLSLLKQRMNNVFNASTYSLVFIFFGCLFLLIPSKCFGIF